MILIPEHPIFTRDENGQKCSFDLRRFNEDLGEAFRLNGVKDSWLVEQFSVSVEEKLRTETMHSTPLSENEIDMLLISILTASGFSDVASSYSELRGSNPMRGFMAGLAPWDDTRLARTLTRCLPLTPKQVAKFVPACHDALEQLHMTSISDAFIVELAIHLAHDDNSEHPGLPECNLSDQSLVNWLFPDCGFQLRTLFFVLLHILSAFISQNVSS